MFHIKLIPIPSQVVVVVTVTVQCLFIYLLLIPEVNSLIVPLEKLTEKEQAAIFKNITTARRTKLVGPLSKRSDTKRELPPNGKLFGEEFYPLECDATYSIPAEGYVFFDLNTDSNSCHYSFLGSKNEGCTVAILCDGPIKLAEKTKNGCEKEYLILSDGTKGRIIGCGKFTFKNTPRIPRNNGSDMYVYVKGNSPNTVCIVFCLEDLELAKYPGVRKPKVLGATQNFTGLWTEAQCKCGIRRDMGRIVNGENARFNEFPWLVGLVYPGTRKPFCGGSLINDRYVISAGHCFHGNSLSYNRLEVLIHAHIMDQNRVMGRGDVNKVPGWNLPPENDTTESSIRLRVIEIRQHPLYDGRSFDYDYAILKLAQPLNLVDPNILVEPICLPSVDEKWGYEDDVTMNVAGWGVPWEDGPATSRILQKLDVPFVNRRRCKQYTYPTGRHLCAGYVEGGKDACSGDSGGPLISLLNPNTNQYFLSGIVSCGAGCARKDELGLYSDVKEAAQWIYFHTPGAVWCAR